MPDAVRPSTIVCYQNQLEAAKKLLASVEAGREPPYEYVEIDPEVQKRVAAILRTRGFPEYLGGK